MQANRHTIILMQTSQNRATRTFMDYESISQAMDGINHYTITACTFEIYTFWITYEIALKVFFSFFVNVGKQKYGMKLGKYLNHKPICQLQIYISSLKYVTRIQHILAIYL